MIKTRSRRERDTHKNPIPLVWRKSKMAAAVFVQVVHWMSVVVLVVILGLAQSGGSEKKAVKDCVGQHVCTTLMRYPDNYIADEGPNCFCHNKRQPACNGEWEDHSTSTLTWQHYERSHWTVQYKFCTPIFENRRPCNEGERAATVTTEVKSWHPDMAEPRCRCPNDLFHIDGWKREGEQWKYFYSCEKVECPSKALEPEPGSNKKTPCAKIYVDPHKSNDKVLEVQFYCACPHAHMCPAHLKKKEDQDRKSDAKGSYVIQYCEPNAKGADSSKS